MTESNRTHDGFLSHQATVEGRRVFASWLEQQAETEAVGSRDFGRGFKHAIALLRTAPAQCYSCDPPRAKTGETVPCPDCGALWRIAPMGMSWVPGGTPGATR